MPTRFARAILLVEDDPDARDLAAEHLSTEGWPVVQAASGRAALAMAEEEDVGLVVLDLGLPDIGGLEVLAELHRDRPELPVILLTAARGEPSRVRGLWSGADDYLEKPYSPRELIARIHSVLRRSNVELGEQRRLGGLVVDAAGRTVTIDEMPIGVTRLEFDVLSYLSSLPGQVVSREQLLNSVWSSHDSNATAASVSEIVRRLRGKLRAVDETRPWITTVRGVGYQFTPDPG